jgi:hypothetical protein
LGKYTGGSSLTLSELVPKSLLVSGDWTIGDLTGIEDMPGDFASSLSVAINGSLQVRAIFLIPASEIL